jgi:hypothetical protein
MILEGCIGSGGQASRHCLCGARTVGGSHIMRLGATACGSETHALRLEAACSSTCGPFTGVPGVVQTCSGVNGRVHRSVDGSLYPCKKTFLLYFTTHFSLSKVTVHPALHSTLIPNKDAIFIPGTICPVITVGRPGILMLHVCVDNTFLPSGRLIVMGCRLHIFHRCSLHYKN